MRRLIAALCFLLPIACAAAVNEFSTTGPYGGWTTLAADPASSGRVIAARGDAVYRTVDGGATWSAATGLGGADAVAFDPADGTRVHAAWGGSLYASTDAGATWSRRSTLPVHVFPYTASMSTVSRLAVSPHASTDLYVTDGTLSYTADAGATFTAIGPPQGYVYDFALAAAARGTIYAGTHEAGFARSADNGVTWVAGAGLPPDYAGVRLADAGDRLYLVVARRNGASTVRYEYDRFVVYASTDGGANWQPTTLAIDGTIAWTQIDLVPVAGQAGHLLLRAGAILAITRDGGVTWSNVALPDHGMAHAIAADAHDLYVSVIGYGVRRSSDGGVTWRRARGGLPPAAVNHVAAIGATFLASTPDVYAPRPAELLRRTQASNTWVASLLLPSAAYSIFTDGDGTHLGVRSGPYSFAGFFPVGDASTAAALSDGKETWQTADAGATWSRIGSNSPFPVDRFAVASDGTTVYACGTGRPSPSGLIWNSGALGRSDDGGKTWTTLASPLPDSYFGCSAIAAAPGWRNVVYLSRTPDIGGGILRTADAGSTWTPVPGTDHDLVSALVVDPANPQRMIVALSNYNQIVMIDAATGARTTIGGGPLNNPRALAIDPFTSPATLYVGAADGVFMRPLPPGPEPWLTFWSTMGVEVHELALTFAPQAPTRRTLAAATSQGVLERTIDDAHALVPVYRLFNARTGSHFFTASFAERTSVLANLADFADEGVAFYGLVDPSPLAVPVHRFYRPARGSHAYATTEAERGALAASGDAVYEGVAYYVLAPPVQEPGALAVHRFVNTSTGGELFTMDEDEREEIVRALPLFAYRGVAFTTYPAAH
jgi:photosystem II stability/assembly factor-like uncharacterized protein